MRAPFITGLILAVAPVLGATAMGATCAAVVMHGNIPMCLVPMKYVTTINGNPLPARVAPLQNASTMLDTFDSDGKRIVVVKGTRKAGTRAPIHIHEYGGTTCVLSGEITAFMEGGSPRKFPAGSCYYMPPNIPMAATNLGREDVVLTDTFILPAGTPTMTVVEPNISSM